MRSFTNKTFRFCIIISVLIFLSSCATTVDVKLTRPANLDLNGAKTIAILPIKPTAYYREYDTSLGVELLINTFYQMFEIPDPDEEAAISLLKNQLERGLMQSPYITLVSSVEVERAKKYGYLIPADVYLTGEVARYNVTDDFYDEKVIVKKAEGDRKAEYELKRFWRRKVEFLFRYQVVDSSTERVISLGEVHCDDDSYKYPSRKELPSAYEIIESNLRSAARKILKELQPYSVIKSIKLLEAKTKDKEIKVSMKVADNLAKQMLIKESIQAFQEIYEEYDLVEAGYNAAILEEALGNLSEAEKMMQALYLKHPDSRVAKGLSDIRNEIALANKLNKQINKKDDEIVAPEEISSDEVLGTDF